MRRVLFFIFTVIFSSLIITSVQAKHIIGGYISYEFISSTNNINKYQITLRVYRDCGNPQNGPFDRPAMLSIATSDGKYYRRDFNMGNPVIKNLSNLFSNPCITKPPQVCVQEGVYTQTVDLPVDPNRSYYIIYQRCCRNETIFNILNPGEYGATYYTEITPLAQQLQNSSPYFKTIPPIAICAGFNVTFDHSAEDIDGDSLVYHMVTPLNGGGQGGFGAPNCQQVDPQPDCLPPYDSVYYRPPFKGQNPMGGSPTVAIDYKTGLLTGTPNIVGQFVVGVRIDEYRNGVLLSSSIRDFQFNVANCEKVVRAELSVETRKGKDIQFKFCGDQLLKIENISSLESSIFNYSWEVNYPFGKDTIFSTKDLDLAAFDYGNYFGKMILNKDLQCTDTATFEFTKFPGLHADYTFSYDTCKDEGVRFVSQSYGDTNLPLTLSWADPDGAFGSTTEIDHGFPGSGDYPVRLTITDTNGCVDSVETVIPYYPIPDKVLQWKQIDDCVPAQIVFPSLHPAIDNSYNIEWDFGDGTTGNGLAPMHEYTRVADYDISVHVTDKVGCEYSGLFRRGVRIHDLPTAGFDYSPKELSNIQPVMKISDDSKDAVKWIYYIGNLDSLTEQHPSYTFRDTGLITIYQVVANQFGCEDTISTLVDVVPINTIYMPNAFLPASSGENSEFRPAGNGFGIVEYEMTVFDRFGEIVFRTDEFNQGWSGKNKNGDYLPNGAYGVKVRLLGPRGELKKLSGKAMLIR